MCAQCVMTAKMMHLVDTVGRRNSSNEDGYFLFNKYRDSLRNSIIILLFLCERMCQKMHKECSGRCFGKIRTFGLKSQNCDFFKKEKDGKLLPPKTRQKYSPSLEPNQYNTMQPDFYVSSGAYYREFSCHIEFKRRFGKQTQFTC